MRHIPYGQVWACWSRDCLDRESFRERFSMEQRAAEAGMSPSSLHEHFRAVTAMTPLQSRSSGGCRTHRMM
jgi:AraC-like DNA-binding protein